MGQSESPSDKDSTAKSKKGSTPKRKKSSTAKNKKGSTTKQREKVHIVLDISKEGVWYPSEEKEVTIGFSESSPEVSNYKGGIFKDLSINDSPEEQSLNILAIGQNESKIIEGRAVIGYSNAGKSINATIRLDSELPEHSKPCTIRTNTEKRLVTIAEPHPKFLFSPDPCIDEIMSLLGLLSSKEKASDQNSVHSSFIFNNDVIERPGLIVLAGATKGGKSLFSKGIALRYIFGLASKNHELTKETLPHLVSIEDPIEAWKLHEVINDNDDSYEYRDLDLKPTTAESTPLGVWFTPRELRKDVSSLDDACNNALRQTPACFFVGEVRDDEDWKYVLKVSLTGHLVICTCHSASLTETFAKILRSQSSTQAFDRKVLAEALLGVIHLKSTRLQINNNSLIPSNINFPMFQIWKQNPNSVADFCSDGLSSIAPDGHNTFSARRVFKGILKRQREYNKLGYMTETQNLATDVDQELYKQAHATALKHDLGG